MLTPSARVPRVAQESSPKATPSPVRWQTQASQLSVQIAEPLVTFLGPLVETCIPSGRWMRVRCAL